MASRDLKKDAAMDEDILYERGNPEIEQLRCEASKYNSKAPRSFTDSGAFFQEKLHSIDYKA